MEKKFGGLIPVYRRMVVKIGTNLLSGVSGKIETGFMDHIARQIALLHQKGVEVLLVTSGAIGAGMNDMPHPAVSLIGSRFGARPPIGSGCPARTLSSGLARLT